MSNTSDAAQPGRPPELDRIVNRMFGRLMPLLVFGYILNFLDRTNISLAKAALQADVGISAAAYGLGAGLFFLAYSACEVPSNLILQRVGARKWIARIMLSWGIVSMGMVLVTGPVSFYILRVLLGVAEAGLFPGVLLYLTYWFGERERARAIGYFLLGVCLANVIGGPIGGALLSLNGFLGLKGWQCMFLAEGLPAALFAVVVWRVLPDGPASAPWLKPDEARMVLDQLERERRASAEGASVKKVFTHPQVLIAVFVYFCHQTALYSVTFFLPGIIRSWGGLSEIAIGLLTSLPWIAAALGATFMPRLAVARGFTRPMMIAGLFVIALALTGPAFLSPALALVAFCVAAFMFFPVQSVLFTYPSARFQGPALAAGLGYLNALGLVGGFIGPSMMGLVEERTGKASNGLLLISVALVLAGLAAFSLREPDRDGAKGRLRLTVNAMRPRA